MIRLRIGKSTLRISKKALRILVFVALVPALLAGLYGLGLIVTPRDGAGRPLIWSPSLRTAERYRERAREWVREMAEIDRRLAALLAAGDTTADPSELYVLGREMQTVGEDAAALARETATVAVPVSLVGLREQAREGTEAYLEAALQTARWLSGPSEAGRRAAVETLRAARALRVEMEASRWLTLTPTPTN